MPLKGGDLNGIGNLFVGWSIGTRIEDGIRVSLSLYHWCDSGRTEGLTLYSMPLWGERIVMNWLHRMSWWDSMPFGVTMAREESNHAGGHTHKRGWRATRRKRLKAAKMARRAHR